MVLYNISWANALAMATRRFVDCHLVSCITTPHTTLVKTGMLCKPQLNFKPPQSCAPSGYPAGRFPAQSSIGCMLTDVEGGGSAAEPVSMGELLGNKGVLIGCAIFLLQQFSGINAIVYFSSSVFAQVHMLLDAFTLLLSFHVYLALQDAILPIVPPQRPSTALPVFEILAIPHTGAARLSDHDEGFLLLRQAGITNAAIASAAVQMTNVLTTVVAASLMDRAGRKQLLTLSFTGMGEPISLFTAIAGRMLSVLLSCAG